MKVLLDTNLLIDDDLHHPGHEGFVSSLSLAELHAGLATAPDPVALAKRQARLARLTHVFGTGLPFDDAAAAAYGTVAQLVVASGRKPRARAIDLMIAATALAHGAGIITRNPADFAGLESVVKVIAA